MVIQPVRVSRHELLLLQAIANGRPLSLTSNHRTRLELLGLVRDGPGGLQLTAEGLRRAREKLPRPAKAASAATPDTTPRDARGRRKRGRHTLPI